MARFNINLILALEKHQPIIQSLSKTKKLKYVYFFIFTSLLVFIHISIPWKFKMFMIIFLRVTKQRKLNLRIIDFSAFFLVLLDFTIYQKKVITFLKNNCLVYPTTLSLLQETIPDVIDPNKTSTRNRVHIYKNL